MPQRTGKIRINSEESQGISFCDGCGVVIDGNNTKGHYRSNRRIIRCGKCYLKMKKERRRRD